MKPKLEDLRETIPQEPERDLAEREDPEDQAYFADQAARIREAERLKDSISEQIRGGNAPEIILLSAVQAIGLLTEDKAWAAEQTARLDTFYNPAIDAAVLAAAGTEERRREYAAAVKRRLVTARNKTAELLDAVNTAIEKADALAVPGV